MMMSRGGFRMASYMMAAASTRNFSVATVRAMSNEATSAWIMAPVVGMRYISTVALGEKGQLEEKPAPATGSAGGSGKDEKQIVSYWGIETGKIKKEDGTEWKWSCFRPWETYQSDTSIDLTKHHKPDKTAY